MILDSGRTRTMGSRYAVEKLQRYVKKSCRSKFTFSYAPCGTKFCFASWQSARVTEKVFLWFDTEPPANITIEILDEGRAPILFSIQQMLNLHMTLGCSPTADFATCEAVGFTHKQPSSRPRSPRAWTFLSHA